MKKAFLALLLLLLLIWAYRSIVPGHETYPKFSLKIDRSFAVGQIRLEGTAAKSVVYRNIAASLLANRFANGEVFELRLMLGEPSAVSSLSEEKRDVLSKANSFLIKLIGNTIEISAPDTQGLIYGVDQLEADLLRYKGLVGYQEYLDAPDHQVRALHIVLRALSIAEIREVIVRARAARFNTLIMAITDQVVFSSSAVKPRPDAMTSKEFLELVEFARMNGLDVVPQITLLTQQQQFFNKSHPSLLYNRYTYDPRKAQVYDLAFSYIDEVIQLIRPSAIHIGHDEVAGIHTLQGRKDGRKVSRVLPPELFLSDVLRLHDFLSDRNIETWMWGDMLISPDELPEMDEANIHGINGYAELRSRLPRDIVICDWHYWDTGTEFPSAALFSVDGYDVLGSTWKRPKNTRRFSRYVAKMIPSGRGMIATTWYHAQRDEWDIVNNIIAESGASYWHVD